MKRRVLSFTIALALCLDLLPVGAFAAELGTGDGLCPHHTEHTDTCGYAPPVLEQECTHSHDDGCFTVETHCIHEHTAECYPPDPVDGSEAGEPVLCAHTCTQESGCVTQVLSCPHVHDGACGYVKGDPGAPCTFVCPICPIEDLIGKLPGSVSEDNCEQVQAQLDEIYARYDELSADEQQQVDLSPCAALLDQVEGMGAAVMSDAGSGSAPTERYVLNGDFTYTTPYKISKSTSIDTNGHTITGSMSNTIRVTGTGELYLIGRGLVISQRGAGVEVQSGGLLNISGEGMAIEGTTYALTIASDAQVTLSAGTYSGTTAAIQTADGDLSALLAPGCAYFDANGNVVPTAGLAQAKTLVVKQCTSHSKTYLPNASSPTHSWTCAYCGTTKTQEKCEFKFTFDQSGKGTCSLCGNEISVEVDRESLKVLAYDDTVQPANGTVTVMVKDAATALTEDTDYAVSYSTRAEVGSTNITVTVTVTGKTYEGTFTQDYTFTKDELTKPVLEWDEPDASVPYTGDPVTKDLLPAVTINIQTGSGVDLHDLLQYSYRAAQGSDAYTAGLPTNAGTYDVVVSLSEGTDYQAASSEPITLTVEPIAPIAVAPQATKPIYDRTAQELVTAGELDPVAIADGLEIQFATEEDGPYSTTIPTGTDAGDSYRVWYKVIGLTGNYIAPVLNPAEIGGVEILRKPITPVVELEYETCLYDGGFKQPKVTVKDEDHVTILLNTEYQVEYRDNRDVGTAKAVVTDRAGGNYAITTVEAPFQITQKPQDTLTITNKPNTIIYGDQFTLETTGGSGSGDVTWEITSGTDVAEVDADSGQVTVIGHGSATVKATKSGAAPTRAADGNYEDATASWTFNAVQRPVTAIVTAEDKAYDGNNSATVHAVVEDGVLAGDEIVITGLTGTFDDENAGTNKNVAVSADADGQPVDASGDPVTVTGKNSQHYAITYSSLTVQAAIHKAVVDVTTPPVPASLTYNGTARALIDTGAVVGTTGVDVEYALSEDGTYSTDFPKGTDAGTYTVWYRVKETDNYTGSAPASVPVTIAKKPVSPVIALDPDSFTYDGTTKEPVVTLTEADGTTIIPAGEYTVSYSDNVNVGTATVTVKAKDGGNYSFTDVTAAFTISQKQAQVVTAPEAAGRPLFFANYGQRLVTAGTAEGGTMVYSVGDETGYSSDIPERTNAGTYTVYYKVQGDANHSDSAAGHVEVTIAPKTVKDPTIELKNTDGSAFVSAIYDGTAKEPKVVVKDGSDIIDADEYEIVYSNNKDAGTATVSITDKPDGNYTVTGSATFVINKADIVFTPAPSAATLTYNGTAQELLVPGKTTGGTVQYALNSATSTFADAIPTGVNAGTYNVYYKVTGDKNHNDLPVQGPVAVTIARKQLTDITIELTPSSFQYDGKAHLPAVTVKDGDTVLPASEYSWECTDNAANAVTAPTQGGTYTITISDKTGGNYDLTKVTTNTATFSIGKAAQEELVIEGKPEQVYYGGTFKLTTTGGSGTGAVTWSVEGPATVDTNGNVAITGVGEVTITAEKAADTNYAAAQAQLTFTAAPKPVTAAVTVNDKSYDGTTAATVASASITTINGDTVTIVPASVTAAFDDPHAGTDKTVTLDTSKVQVTGDTAKYAISYPNTVTAEITKATTTIGTDPAAIASLTYSGQPQALVRAGKTNVGFLVYSLSETGEYSREIPTGTNARTYTVYYKVDETGDYTGVAVNMTPISVTIAPKDITPKVELSQSSFLYDGTKKEPKITVKDGDTVLREDQDYTATWANEDPSATGELLTAAGAYTAAIKSVANGNYSFTAAARVEIKAAVQEALNITGTPEHVYYGDTIATLKATGGSGNGTVTWSITDGNASADIDPDTGVLTVKGTGPVTVKAERTVPNYAPATGTWTFTVEPKPVVAEVTVKAKDYDGTTAATVTASVKPGDLVNGDTVTISGLTGVYADANAGTGKPVTLDTSTATTTADPAKYTVTYPAMATGDIGPRQVTVTVTLSGNDLEGNATDGYYYNYDGADKTPTVTVKGTDDGGYNATLAASDYDVAYTDNKNVGDATVTVTAKAGGNYAFDDAETKFAIRKAAAALTSSPQAKDLTYTGEEQELVTVGTATGGHLEYSLDGVTYSEAIPKAALAKTYTVTYKVVGDGNHEDDTTVGSVTVTIKPKTVISPKITVDGGSFTYTGNVHEPAVTVEDGGTAIPDTEYTLSYQNNVNTGTATVIVRDNNGGNYIVNGSVTFAITKAAPTYTDPTAIGGLQYNGELQDLVTAGVTSEGTVVYSVNGGNDSPVIPMASAVGTYTISWKVVGDANHSDTAAATLTVTIAKNTVDDPTITLSQDQFTYDGNQHKPTVTVYDKNSRPIPAHEYTVSITPKTTGNTSNMVDVDTYIVTVTTPDSSNYVIRGRNTREFKIVPADQETISVTGTKAQVRYGDEIQLGVSGGTGSGTVTWEITGNTYTTLTQGGLLTVKDVNTPIKVTVTRSRDNYGDVSATWEFTAAKKPVTAVLTGVDKPFDGNVNATVKAKVDAGDLVFGDTFSIPDLTGTFDNKNVGTNKTITITGSAPTITDPKAANYDITYPATTTASILAVAATVDTVPKAVASLTYDASQAQELVTAGAATGGTMVYSLDGVNFTPNIPKAKNAGTYKVYYKAQGDSDHTDSAISSVNVTIAQQTIAEDKLQIELSPPSAQYDGNVHQPAVTLRDPANNVIPDSEYKVTYVSDGGANWKDRGTYEVKVEDITGGNYVVNTKTADFTISTSAQAPLEIVGKPGVVHYGDTFTLSATGGSSSQAVTWSSSDENIAHIDANGLVTIKGVGQATITATKAGGGNYEEATATYPLNALKKPVMATVTADDKVYDGNTNATIHVTWSGLVGDDAIDDAIDISGLSGAFEDAAVGANKTVNITTTTGSPISSDKYDITIPSTTTASITKATAAAPNVTAASGLTYTGSAQALVSRGDANTLYSASRDGVYSATDPAGTNAGTYTVWYKAKGDTNHNESVPQSIQVTISPKTLALTDANIELSGNDLNTETAGDDTTYYYEYDGTEKTPSVVVKDGAAPIPASEYTVTYSGNKSVGTATVTITDNEGGNYTVSGSVTFEIRKGGAQLTSSPQARDLTYTGQPQELVTVGTATGGHLEYSLDGGAYSEAIPKADLAKTYTVTYKVVGDGNHEDDTTVGSVTVTIKPKTVISPKITVDGGSFTYTGSTHEPTVTIEDGDATIDAGEYTLSYQNNVNAGTATVIVRDNNGGNYTVNGTATFEIGKATAAVGTAPTGKTDLPYNGTEQALIEAGSSADGTMVYALEQDGEYSAAIPTGKAVKEYTVWYKVLGDSNHTDSASQSVTASIAANEVTRPTIQVTPPSVKYTGEKQTPTVTVRDDDGLLIDGSEYEVTYVDDKGSVTTDPTAVGTYTLTITGGAAGNYTFDIAADVDPVTFTITPADQSALTITGTRERVYYGDTIQLGATGGISGGTVTWKVNDGAPASINTNGLLTITGVGSVTVTATSTKPGYNHQTATWTLYAEKKQVTAVVTAQDRTYTGDKTATLSVTWEAGDLVGNDNIDATGLTGEFTDANVGANKTVKITGTLTHANYDITVPPTTTASIFKADVTDVTPPAPVADLKYTGLPQALVTAGSSAQGTLEYSLDGLTYSASLPTGTDEGSYDVWYRVKGDGNHNDTTGTKLTSDTSKVTIAKQTVDTPTIEFNPTGASYDGQEHRPEVTVKDAHGRTIPAAEYTVSYGSTNWKDVGDHKVKITAKDGGNYTFDETEGTFTILPAGQSPLSIVGQPGRVQYGSVFTLSTNGGSGTGAVTWASSDGQVAFVNSQTGRVEILKAGGPVTITARKAAGGGYGEATATWTFSAEKKPVTPIVTAQDKVYDATDTAELVITWKDGDLLGNDSIAFDPALTGKFSNANVGDNKTVTITGAKPTSDKYDVTIPSSTTASITPKTATVTGVTAKTDLVYNGSAQELVSGGTATGGTVEYSLDGSSFGPNIPKAADAGSYTVWYKAVADDSNYVDSARKSVLVTIDPKPVANLNIELSPTTFDYDGTAKKPDVVVKDGNTVISPSEYTVSYSNNIAVSTNATVTITDVTGGNYTVNGSATFAIKAGTAALKEAPQPRELTYTGAAQTLVTAGSAVNGKVVYSLDPDGAYSASIPRGSNAGDYEVWYKVQGDNGADDTQPQFVTVTIQPKEVTPTILLNGQYAFSATYTGSAITPTVTVNVGGEATSSFTHTYSNNIKVGTATVTVQSTGGNYKFFGVTTFEITKGKAAFMSGGEPVAKAGLVYTGEPQELVQPGLAAQSGLLVVYSTDGATYLPVVPTATDRGNYLVIAKVQGNEMYEDSDPVILRSKIDRNRVENPTVTLSATSMNYTGSELKPTVTVISKGATIPASEYTVSYSDNINKGTATVTVTGNTNNYTYFTKSVTFQIVDASQPVLTITGKPDRVRYGDTIATLKAEGASGAVAWSVTGTGSTIDQATGRLVVKDGGAITVTASSGSLSDSWTFTVEPKPVTAVVTAASKPYDGGNTATLTVTISNGLVPGDSIPTNTDVGVKATGHFADASVGENKTVVIDGLTIPAEVSAKYDISWPSTTTASITPAPAEVTDVPTLATGPLTYNGGEQALLASGGTADGGNLMYSLDGKDYGYTIPTGTDAGSYTVWYKVAAGDENHKDSAAVKLGPVTIDPYTGQLSVLCTPDQFRYDGTAKVPTVVVRDGAQRILPESEYTVTLPAGRIAVGTYTVTVTDRSGGNYQFDAPVTGTFNIVASSQDPLSIITDIPTNVHYGDTFRLSAMGGSGGGAIQWSIEGTAATINDNGVVTVTGIGGFTVKAYRAGADGYSDSNTASVPFVAKQKPVTPVVTASDKPYDRKTDATLTASWKSGDLVSGDTITITATGAFATADAGTGKRVSVIGNATGTDDTLAKYAITWPDSTTASIYRVNAELETAPAGIPDLKYTGDPLKLITSGGTKGNIGTIEYSTSQNGAYSTTIPTGTNAGTYKVWYKVADSVNYMGIPATEIEVVIGKAAPAINTNPTASGTAGQKLSDIELNGGATDVPGTFDWESPETVAEAGKAYPVIFTPDDGANYEPVTFTLTPVSASSNDSGTGGTGGTNTTLPVETVSDSTQTTIRDGTANTVLSASDGDQLVKEAVKDQSDTIVIKPEIAGDVTKTQVSIPASTVSQISSQTDAALTVASPIADVTIPNGALNTLSRAGGTVNVVTEQVGGAVALTLTADGKTVEDVPGGVTLTVPAQDAGAGTVAVLVHDDGTREVLQRSVVKDGKLSAPLSGSATVEIVDNGKSFADVPDTDWAAEAVTFASARELFNGTSETTFSPDDTTSRGMVATVLYRLEGQPDQALTDVYNDVSDDAWYADSVAWAAENGIVNGYGDGQFGPNDSVTREQFVVMLWRYLGSPEANDHDLAAFTDADQINGYAREALCWAVENGVLNGNGGGQLVPGGTATRAEAAQMLKNFIENT